MTSKGKHGDGGGGEASPRETQYTTKITLACDTSKIRYNPETGTAKIMGGATLPPRLARYAEQSGHAMPEGLYGFFGERASANLQAEVMNHLERRQKGDGFLWDLQASLTFSRKPGAEKARASLVWKDPTYLQASFVRVGKPSKEAADLLRYFVGDSHALDRLTLEPWLIDTYAAVLSEAYGPMRAIVFDAMMDDDSIVPLVRIYDPTLVSGAGVIPLFHYLSSKDPGQPEVFELPEPTWGGWQLSGQVLSPRDRDDISEFQRSSRKERKTRERLKAQRVRFLRQEGRFPPRDEELRVIVNRRLDGVKANTVVGHAQRQKEQSGNHASSTGGASGGTSMAM